MNDPGLYWGEDLPPVEIAELVNASFPNHLLKLVHQRLTKDITEADK